MKTILTKYLFNAIFVAALINPLATSTVFFINHDNEDSVRAFMNNELPIWFEQAKLLLARIKAEPNLNIHLIAQYKEEFYTLNKNHDADNYLFAIWRNEPVFWEESRVYGEIHEILDSLWIQEAMALYKEMRADKQLKFHLAKYIKKRDQLMKKHNVTENSLSNAGLSPYWHIENLISDVSKTMSLWQTWFGQVESWLQP